MAGRRFMINSRSIRNGYASFDGDLHNHIVRVLRLGTGDAVTLVDERGDEHEGVIDQVTREWVAVKITSKSDMQGVESRGPQITICQALPKGDKIDLILQKGTELGVKDFWLFGGRRSVARVHEDQRSTKLERWNRITAEAARQCGRRSIPQVAWFPSVVEVAGSATHDLRLLLWEGEKEHTLRSELAHTAVPSSAIVTVGPEGGFDPLEVRHFAQNGFKPVTLGSRVLRTETVTIAIMAILQYIWDEM